MEQFFECEAKIIKHISSKVKDRSMRDDLLQEIFVKFTTKFDTIKHHENLRGYLYRIADNVIADYYRKESRFLPVEDERIFDRPVPAATLDYHHRLADLNLRSFIDQLPAKYRQILILIELEGKSQKAVAEAMGMSYSAIKSRVQRAREMLKKAILDCCDYEFDKYGNIVDCCASGKN
jgi:RNA polymerase sigma-70 factor, ECF subfamily